MNTKKLIFAVLASATLLAISCSPNTTSDDDQLYDQGIDRKKMVRRN